MSYGYSKETNLDFNEAVEKTKEELKTEGFGVLTEIDVKKTLKAKLDVDYDDYVILGACNPGFAYKALQAEKEIGLLLPCNVIIYVKHKVWRHEMKLSNQVSREFRNDLAFRCTQVEHDCYAEAIKIQ